MSEYNILRYWLRPRQQLRFFFSKNPEKENVYICYKQVRKAQYLVYSNCFKMTSPFPSLLQTSHRYNPDDINIMLFDRL